MWMVFNAGNANGNNMIGRTNENTTCTSMLNGLLCVGRDHFGFHMINFIADRARFKENGYDTPHTSPIGTNRNGGNTWLGTNVDGNDLVNDLVNDVAMTVLPNAPIDDATGLPIPTIAVATDGGVSVIRDHGPVYDITTTVGSNNQANHITFNKEKTKLSWLTRDGAIYALVTDIPDADITARQSDDVVISLHTSYTPGTGHDIKIINGSNYNDLIHSRDNILAFAAGGSNSGLQLVDYDYENLSGDNQGKVCQVTTSFNTGWQYGDIKGAFLSDTDDTNVTGSELVTNGTFDSDTSNWTAVEGATLSVSSNRLVVTGDGSTAAAGAHTKFYYSVW